MILHLLSDNKFADYAINQFERVQPGGSEYVVFVSDRTKPLQHIKNIDRVELIVYGSLNFQYLCDRLSNYSSVITHNLNTRSQVELIEKVDDRIKIGWVYWGFELYNRRDTYSNLAPKTQINYWKFISKKRFNNIIGIIKHRKLDPGLYEVPRSIYQRIDFCLTHIYEDYEQARRFLKGGYSFKWFCYYSIEDTVGVLFDSRINGQNILVGNSAAFSNNHIEAFHMLSKLNLSDRKIIVPLSYGNKWNAKYIEQKGDKIFGSNFLPLVKFLERNEYNKVIQSCSIVIMNHYRQQALGNIITVLWLGAKLYISKKTPTFSYLKRLGIKVFSIEDDLKATNKNVLEPLPERFADINRNILFEQYSREKADRKIEELINQLEEN